MKLLLLLVCMLLPFPCAAEDLNTAIADVVAGLDGSAMEEALQGNDPFESTGGFAKTLLGIAKGEIALSFGQTMAMAGSSFFAAARESLWHLTQLLAPALAWSLLRRLSEGGRQAGETVCYLLACTFLARDLADHLALCTSAMEKIAGGMQGLFPMLLTLMAAVGTQASQGLMEPAVVAAAGEMTAFIRHVTLPLASSAAVLMMLCHLGRGLKLSRLHALAYQAAAWTLGLCFTAFMGVLVTRGVTAAAIDGIGLRTAKYALDNMIPVVGGLFADTVDALVGASMLVQGALGVTGLILVAGWALGPLCQTLAAAMIYRLASALMQPVADGELAGCLHDFSRVLMLLFAVEVSTAAMYLLLVAQLVGVSGMTMMLR